MMGDAAYWQAIRLAWAPKDTGCSDYRELENEGWLQVAPLIGAPKNVSLVLPKQPETPKKRSSKATQKHKVITSEKKKKPKEKTGK